MKKIDQQTLIILVKSETQNKNDLQRVFILLIPNLN